MGKKGVKSVELKEILYVLVPIVCNVDKVEKGTC